MSRLNSSTVSVGNLQVQTSAPVVVHYACKYAVLGCEFLGNEAEVQNHHQNNDHHMQVILNFCAYQKKTIVNLYNENALLKEAFRSCNEVLSSLSSNDLETNGVLEKNCEVLKTLQNDVMVAKDGFVKFQEQNQIAKLQHRMGLMEKMQSDVLAEQKRYNDEINSIWQKLEKLQTDQDGFAILQEKEDKKLQQKIIFLEKTQSDLLKEEKNMQQKIIVLEETQSGFLKEEKFKDEMNSLNQKYDTEIKNFNQRISQLDTVREEIINLKKNNNAEVKNYKEVLTQVNSLKEEFIKFEKNYSHETNVMTFHSKKMKRQIKSLELRQAQQTAEKRKLDGNQLNIEYPGPNYPRPPVGSKTSIHVWKIENFLQQLKFSRYLTSDAFYTEPHHYKMKLELYPEGLARLNYMSCFLTMMKSGGDKEYKWPASGSARIKLVNQLKDKDHYYKGFEFSYFKPTSDEGQTCGCAELIEFNKLQPLYLVDDTLIMQIILTFND